MILNSEYGISGLGEYKQNGMTNKLFKKKNN